VKRVFCLSTKGAQPCVLSRVPSALAYSPFNSAMRFSIQFIM
jgi:hypothetical protein